MSANVFHFKQFSLCQQGCAMKVGTDSVLLGAWAALPPSGNILDIGTGTGILAIMAAQRTADATVTAVEIDPDAACRARENVRLCPWSNRITVIRDDFNTYAGRTADRFHAILSNPPYFDDDLLPPDEARRTARHTVSLHYAAIFSLSRQVLLPGGSLSLVVPVPLYSHVDKAAMLAGWSASRLTLVSTRLGKPPKRALCEWQYGLLPPPRVEHLAIEDAPGKYSQAYSRLTGDFYLHL